MAVGDVISNTEVSVGGSNTVDFKPASGVEWLIHLLAGTNGGVWIRWGDRNDQMILNHRAGSTSPTDTYGANQFSDRVRFHLTNTVFLRFRNETGTSRHGVYCGIETK